jgi:hypothetical protein
MTPIGNDVIAAGAVNTVLNIPGVSGEFTLIDSPDLTR